MPGNRVSRPTSLEENLAGTPEDDDLNNTIVALRVLERHGAAFTSDDVAHMWLVDLPAGRTFTAERVAYRNLLDGISPPLTARVRNPFREWDRGSDPHRPLRVGQRPLAPAAR